MIITINTLNIFIQLDAISLSLCITFSLFFSITKNYNLYLSNNKKHSELIRSRLWRCFFLLLYIPNIFIFGILDFKIALIFQIVSFISGSFIYFTKYIDLKKFKLLFDLDLTIWKLCTLRSLSLVFDMIHIPLFFYALNDFVESNEKNRTVKIIAIGLAIPSIGIITQILNELFRGFRENLYLKFKRSNDSYLLRNFIFYVLIINGFTFYLYSELLYNNLLFLIFGKILSSFTGILVFKLQIEKLDLSINILVGLFISFLIFFSYDKWLLVNMVLFTIGSKYYIMTYIVIRKTYKL